VKFDPWFVTQFQLPQLQCKCKWHDYAVYNPK